MGRTPVLFVIDVANKICSADPSNPVSTISTERAIQIAADGRKFGVYLLFSTQRPDTVHENVVLQCDNLLPMRMNYVADLSRLFSLLSPGLMAGAPSFGLGQALLTGRIFPQGCALAQMGDRVPQDGAADIPTTWAQARTAEARTS